MTGSTSATDVTDTPRAAGPVRVRGRRGGGRSRGLAFVADLVEGIARGEHPPARVIGGGVLRRVTTLLYHLLALLVSRRWSGAYVLDPVPAENYVRAGHP